MDFYDFHDFRYSRIDFQDFHDFRNIDMDFYDLHDFLNSYMDLNDLLHVAKRDNFTSMAQKVLKFSL